ncbi:spermidine synthase [Hydrogenophaga sp.]|uniref:spermidine synthase n=1 Tax=Hydrogenophaga sp. TaxID=1904254 RepID=UPI0027203E35|nr:fused MFS/spermidine synthase [Hydrogenophaga sp.]MDO9436853.1 fused MFS/spermidine synthase [Hydrogenophaga sp.]
MPLFAATVFLSAFLLFQIQPIVAKMILPWFGGSSSVWTLCMVFFQVELLLGYAYVHLVHEKLSARRQPWVHGALLLLSLATLPVVADPSWKLDAQAYPTWSVLGVLATTVGVPYLLLSTTGPLMQAWYARAFASHGVQPYRLYALSNLASMLALLSYPVLVEPALAVKPQAWVWSAGYALFVLACVATAAYTLRRQHNASTPHAATLEDAPHPGWRACLMWVGLAATASMLLLAITRHLTQDVAPVPFLWVLPLALYLLSFILCFDAPRYYVRPLFLGLLPLAFVALDFAMNEGLSVPVLVALLCAAVFVFCMVCHGELVRRRPPLRHLTLFYLMLSVGGALGGLFVGLVAPVAFNAYFELPLGLFLCALLMVLVLWPEVRGARRGWLRGALLLALLLYGARLASISLDYVQGYTEVVRNFYSQTRIEDSVDSDGLGPVRSMVHGSITHGEQVLNHPKRATAYYCERTGIGRAMQSLPTERPRELGVVGLGAGTLAVYGRAGDEMRMVEINDQVLNLARRHFTFLSDSAARIVPLLGDGRLVLEREAPQAFDLLAIDAFSGDSIPTHLLTLEAFDAYQRHMRPDGLLAVHITNKYLDLRPVMASAAQHIGKIALLLDLPAGHGDPFCRRSSWVVFVNAAQAAALPPTLQGAQVLQPRPGFRPWTDTFSNLFDILI